VGRTVRLGGLPGSMGSHREKGRDVSHAYGGQRHAPDRARHASDVFRIAEWQGGVIGVRQLLDAELSRRAIDRRVATGSLTPYHRGVLAIAGAHIGPRGRSFAALLAGGDGAVLSHRSAAANWQILPEPAIAEITVQRQRRSRDRLVVHRSGTLLETDVRQRAGLAVTSPLRTLLDLATVEPDASLERAVAEARVLRLLDAQAIRTAHGHRGAKRLLAALDGADAAPTQSELERTMMRLVRDAGLLWPVTQVLIAGQRADFAWPEQRLIVEVDGWAAHGHRVAFERDRARDLAHTLAGWTVVRFTHRGLTARPLEAAARLAALLGAGAGHGRPPPRRALSRWRPRCA
jgi:very-short-patch-repair endonuclease